MKALLQLTLFAFVMLSSVGCSSEPAETTLTITHILCIPTGVTRDGNFSIQYKFFEWIDGKLKQIEFAQPTSE